MPVLEIDGKTHFPESMAIARYLAREFGKFKLCSTNKGAFYQKKKKRLDFKTKQNFYVMVSLANLLDETNIYKRVIDKYWVNVQIPRQDNVF